jgi:hypothetical protein
MFHSGPIKWFLILLVVLILATSTYALAASNIVPSRKAGEGAAAINGYVISNIQYVVDSTLLNQVKVTLDAAATTVKVKPISSSSTYYTCSIISGNNWGCATTSPQVNASDADQLRVIATQ